MCAKQRKQQRRIVSILRLHLTSVINHSLRPTTIDLHFTDCFYYVCKRGRSSNSSRDGKGKRGGKKAIGPVEKVFMKIIQWMKCGARSFLLANISQQ